MTAQRSPTFPVLMAAILMVGAAGSLRVAARSETNSAGRDAVARQIIAREKAWAAAWQRQDKAFMADYYADDVTLYLPWSPYLEANPQEDLFPRFAQILNQYQLREWRMYNPHVQVYGDVAILTYNDAVTASVNGKPLEYTGKATAIFVKQGSTWRLVHGHESMNPGAG
jgi:ketosteroid isomerase-like protein